MAVRSSAARARLDGKFGVSVYGGEDTVVGATHMLVLGSSDTSTLDSFSGTSAIASRRNATATAHAAVVATGIQWN